MPTFVAPQLCLLADEPPSGAIWAHEIKFDGYRMQLRVHKHRAVLKTRKALDWSARFPEIVAQGAKLCDCLVDGEVCALNANGLSDFARLQQALSAKKTDALVYYMFDLLFEDGVDLRECPLSVRKQRLANRIEGRKDIAHLRYVEHLATDGKTILESACRCGLEGIVSKRLDAPYRSGRNGTWTKVKCRGGQEVVIGGWWGGKTKLRALVIGAFWGPDFVYLGRVGTGFNAENSGPLLAALNRIARKTSPFTAGPKPVRTSEITWVEPKLVAEVEYASITAKGLLRQASFKALREDKPARAVTLEVPGRGETARREAIRTAQGDITRRDDLVAGVAITNPDKVLWPFADGAGPVTKLKLARYYELAGARMLPHLVGRPLSLVRAPDGIGGQKFFQRHLFAGVVGGRPISIAGEKQPFYTIDCIEGLVGLAQAAVLEIHPWGSRPDSPEIPEIVVFDLDPGQDVTFDELVAASREIGELLAGLSLTPFAKLTGGKGMHVIAPIAGTRNKPPSWDDAKAFAFTFAQTLAHAAPSRYVVTKAKKHRGGKIFVDYLRNTRMATAVAPYSPRARPGATIAMPLAWHEVKPGLDPKAFTIASATKWLQRADPWKNFARAAGSLETAWEKLK
jgi:bifunctional non-homologous end joining protein LigD